MVSGFVNFLINYFLEAPISFSIFTVLLGFIFSYSFFPLFIRLCYSNNLISKPNERSSHKENTPNLGGVAIAVGLLLVILIFGVGMFYLDDYKLLTSMCVSILILLVVGIRDDVVGVSPKIKLLIEIVTVTIFTLITDVKIESFYGIFGVYELPNILSYLFTVFVFVVIINSYNLIDGIDGLAGTIAVVILFFLLCSFVESSYYFVF